MKGDADLCDCIKIGKVSVIWLTHRCLLPLKTGKLIGPAICNVLRGGGVARFVRVEDWEPDNAFQPFLER